MQRHHLIINSCFAAFTIYKSFEAEKSFVFDRVIQMIGSAIEVTFLIYSELYTLWSMIVSAKSFG
jgi:hypothetical protein